MPSFAFHLYSCKKLLDKVKLFKKTEFGLELALVGSVLVDFENIGVLKKVHGRSRDFLKYLLEKDPKYAPLAVGMIMHEHLDDFVDRKYINPNEAYAQELVENYAGQYSSIKFAGHYLLDYSMDGFLLEQKKEIPDLMEAVKKKLKKHHIKKIAYHLSTFFEGDYGAVLRALYFFKKFEAPTTLEDIADLLSRYYFIQANTEYVKKAGLMSKLKLGFNYGKFVLKRQSRNVKELFLKAREAFKEKSRIIEESHNVMEDYVNKLIKSYTLNQ